MRLLWILICLSFLPTSTLAQSIYATQVIDFDTQGGGGGGIFNPALALGAPLGGGFTSGSLDTHSLGPQGHLTLGFDVVITNGPGADFIISENPFYAFGSSSHAFTEAVFVEVSSDGVQFARFPSLYYGEDLDPGIFGSLRIGSYEYLAGATPVLMGNPSFPLADPQDAVEAGGDAFDLADLMGHPMVASGLVDLNAISQIRLVDAFGGVDLDSQGNTIWDNGTSADIDAITVIHHSQNQNANRPHVNVYANAKGKLFVSVTDPNGINDLDMTTFQVAVFGFPYTDPLNATNPVMVITQTTSNGFTARLIHSLFNDEYEMRLAASIRDLSGNLSSDQKSRPPATTFPKYRLARYPILCAYGTPNCP